MKEILCFLLVCSTPALSGPERIESGARPASMGTAYTALADDLWAIGYNAAGLSFVTGGQIGIYCSPSLFGLPELNEYALNGALPVKYGTVGFSVRRFGNDLYEEISLTSAYSVKLSSVSAGINLSYNSVSIENYGSSGTITADVGAIVSVAGWMRCGLRVRNINSPSVGRSDQKLLPAVAVGAAFYPVDDFCIAVDVKKDDSFGPSVCFGFEYVMIHHVSVRSGFIESPEIFSAGAGFRILIFQFDYGLQWHRELGLTHLFSLVVG